VVVQLASVPRLNVMIELNLKCVDVFTTTPFGGNPAGVITVADTMDTGAMQAIASGMKMNLVEMGFVTASKRKDASFRLRYFTPSRELDTSGHVTIAAVFALVEDGMILLENGRTKMALETNVGIVPVDIFFREDPAPEITLKNSDTDLLAVNSGHNCGVLEKIMIRQPVHRYKTAPIPVDELAGVLGIDAVEISRTGLPVTVASHDLDWLIIPVKHRDTIINMKPDLIKLAILNKRYGVQTNHVFTLDTFNTDCITYARHFGPAMGLWEDPASATASAGLSTYLLEYGVANTDRMIMEQGKEPGSIARIHVEVSSSNGNPESVWVGGLAVTSITRRLDLMSGEVLTT
jgi:trans-2,3-dihydro-3-hydroxyanthranilate isomerase